MIIVRIIKGLPDNTLIIILSIKELIKAAYGRSAGHLGYNQNQI